MLLNCFKCDKELEPAFSDNPFKENQPFGGTVFTTHGHYGSTVFDPAGWESSRFLELTICDECLVANKEQVLHGTRIPNTEFEYEQWNPNAED